MHGIHLCSYVSYALCLVSPYDLRLATYRLLSLSLSTVYFASVNLSQHAASLLGSLPLESDLVDEAAAAEKPAPKVEGKR